MSPRQFLVDHGQVFVPLTMVVAVAALLITVGRVWGTVETHSAEITALRAQMATREDIRRIEATQERILATLLERPAR